MGRGHLIRAAAALGAFALAAPAAGGTFREIADGLTTGAPATRTVAYIALSRSDAAAFSRRLGRGVSKLDHVNWKTTAVVAVLADWGCGDNLVGIGDVRQKGAAVHVLLVHGEPPAGTAECQALYGVYRLLTMPKSGLHRPYPSRAVIDVA